MASDEEIMDDIVEEARFDWIELSHALAVVRIDEGPDDEIGLLRRAGPLVVRLVREGRLVPGEIGTRPGSFIAWPLPAGEAADVIVREVDDVLSGRKEFEPWALCMFADAESESLERGRQEMKDRRAGEQ